MIRLRKQQLQAFKQNAFASFKAKLVAFFEAEYAGKRILDESTGLPSSWLLFVDNTVEKAQQNGFIKELHIKLFCELYLLTEGQLLEHPHYQWVRQLWADMTLAEHIKCTRLQSIINDKKQRLV